MIRMILVFAIVFAVFWIGILTFRTLTGLEKWELTKTVAYAILCAVLTMLVLVGIVIVF